MATFRLVAELLLAAALLLCAYSYAGYPLLLAALSPLRRRRKASARAGDGAATAEPTVSLLIPAYNEENVIGQKIVNSLSLDYPAEKLQIRVVSDGSDDATDQIARQYASRGVELQRVSPRGGKPNAINQAVPHARGEILLLCDANTMFAPDAVRQLVRHFADPAVGAVTGDVRLQSAGLGYGHGEGVFSRLERFTQRCEGEIWTAIGVDGGMYALRRELYVPNSPDTLVDDFVIAMNVARAGKRVLFDAEARAFEDAVADARQEFRRRTRTTAGGFQTLLEGRGRPRWNQPGLWAGYLSHKVLRWIGPWLLVLALLANATVVAAAAEWDARTWFFAALLGLQGLFYALAALGWMLRRRTLPRVVSLPFYFCLGNAAAAAGFFKWLLGKQSVTWAKADRTQPVAQPQAGGPSSIAHQSPGLLQQSIPNDPSVAVTTSTKGGS